MVCLSAKIWLVEEIGATTHGAEIPLPKIEKGNTSYDSSTQTVYIQDSDTYDIDVILHELDHHFMHKKDGWNLPGGRHAPSDHLTNKQLAWSEGWATFSACAKQKKSTYKDVEPGNNDDIDWNLENDSIRYGERSPWRKIPGGADVEGAVAGILWDLFDGAATGTADKDRDGVSIPFKCIWKAINKDSDPAAVKNPARTIEEFYKHLENILKNDKDCKNLGVNLNKVKKIFQDHGVSVS